MSFNLSAEEASVIKVNVPVQNITSDTAYISWPSAKEMDSKISDYVIVLNGKKLQNSASQMAYVSSPTNNSYRGAFYSFYTKKLTGLDMIRTDVTFYKLENLQQDTDYTAEIYTVRKNKVSDKAYATMSFRTRAAGSIIDVSDFGAVSTEKIITCDNKEEKLLIESNTKAVQKAIDRCPVNGTVYIPNGIYMCGGLNLKSNMTLKIDGVLCGSPYAEHYKSGFLMYSYFTDERFYGLLNVNGAENLTITGKGTVDGNGWFFADEKNIPSDVYQVYSEEGDVDFSKTKTRARKLIRYVKSNKKRVYSDGILAKSCALSFLNSKGLTPETASDRDLASAYSSRGTTVILKNVKGLLVSELLFINPANHMISIIDSQDVTVTGITELTYNANNGDGIGLNCSRNIKVFNNFMDCGDDAIVFGAGVGKAASASGQSYSGDAEIFGNYIHHGHGGVAMGSHTALGLHGIHIHDNIFNHTDSPFRIKSAPANGGEVYDILFENNCIAYASVPFTMSTDYDDAGTVSKYGAADSPCYFHNIVCRNCTVFNVSGCTFYVTASDGYQHDDILFQNIIVKKAAIPEKFIRNADVKFIK